VSAMVKPTADGQLPEDSVTRAWDADLQEAVWGGKTSDVLRRLVRRCGVVRSRLDAIEQRLWLDAPSAEGSASQASDAAAPG
jgi:hypothetical protein